MRALIPFLLRFIRVIGNATPFSALTLVTDGQNFVNKNRGGYLRTAVATNPLDVWFCIRLLPPTEILVDLLFSLSLFPRWARGD